MPSSPQVVAVVQVFDYELDGTGKPFANAPVSVRLDYSEAQSITPVTNIESSDIATTTDANGYWTVSLVANDNITPANTTYTVRIPNGRTYQISVTSAGVPAGGWQSSAILVSAPASPAFSVVTTVPALTVNPGPLTVTGNETVSGTLAVTGAVTLSSTLATGGNLTVPAGSRIDTASAGALTIMGTTGTTLNLGRSGQVTAVAGNETVAGTLGVTGVTTLGTANITTAAVSGNETVGGTLGVTGEATAPDYKATGVANLGSPASSRYIGRWTTAGSPTGLTAQVGDHGFDSNEALWVATAAGTPGTWQTFPLGTLSGGYQQITSSSQSGITTITDVTGLSATVTVGSGRRIKVTAYCGFADATANDEMQAYIREGSTQLQTDNMEVLVGGRTAFAKMFAILTPTAGSHTYKVSVARSAGTGSITVSPGTTFPAFIQVEDCGV